MKKMDSMIIVAVLATQFFLPVVAQECNTEQRATPQECQQAIELLQLHELDAAGQDLLHDAVTELKTARQNRICSN